MTQILNQMLAKYDIKNIEDKKNSIKEIIQEIVLGGLARGGFFNEAAFYGGTALRIFYGLDRFSEDLDFSLIASNDNFDLTKYFRYIEDEIKSLGLKFEVIKKEKNIVSNIESAFLKGNTKELMLIFYEGSKDIDFIQNNEIIKIKFEVDTNPPLGATFETKFSLQPYPYQVKLFDMPSLFAGKIHACLCRNWKTRVKGRDFYDYVFFLSLNTKVNFELLKSKLVESKFIPVEYKLTKDNLKDMLIERFKQIDFQQAKEDVLPFVKNKNKLDIWSNEFFVEITKSYNNF